MRHHTGLSNSIWIYAVKAKLHTYNVTQIKELTIKHQQVTCSDCGSSTSIFQYKSTPSYETSASVTNKSNLTTPLKMKSERGLSQNQMGNWENRKVVVKT